ncbi:TPA: hypothetical protein MO350_005856 [Salmonella enterica subsp. enterica serovar Java]|nr:hypothetical protein [Salmonella enterica subsp. enterica serovar Java]
MFTFSLKNEILSARQGKARQGKARQGKARQGKARQGSRVWTATSEEKYLHRIRYKLNRLLLSDIPGITIHFVNTSTTGVPSMIEVTAAPLSWKTINIDACILHAFTAPFTQYQEGIRFSLLSSAVL